MTMPHLPISRKMPAPARTRPETISTLTYYESQAADYAAQTRSIDLSLQHDAFAALLPDGGRVLDAGCGSGRDTMALRKRGFEVLPADASPALALEAEHFLGTPVQVLRHQDVSFENEFDGIWAMATLLHVPREELGDVFRRYERALKSGGVMTLSFKIGAEDSADAQGRWFTRFDARTFVDFLKEEAPSLAILRLSENEDASRPDTKWLTATLMPVGR